MHDRDDDELPPGQPNQDPVKELKTVAFLLNGLYKQLADERDTITMASGQMTHAGKQFQDYIKKFADVDQRIRNTIAQTIQQSAEKAASDMADTVGDKVAVAATEHGEAVVKNLRKAASEAVTQLNAYQQTLAVSTYWRWGGFLAIALLSGFLSAMTIHHAFPEQTFTREQWNQMEAGKTLIGAWDKLSQAERNKILALSRGENPPPPVKKKKQSVAQEDVVEAPSENQYDNNY